MSEIRHTATFGADADPERIRAALACPVCGHQEPGVAHLRITDNSLRIFCNGCAAFIVVSLSDEQARAIERCSGTRETIGQRR